MTDLISQMTNGDPHLSMTERSISTLAGLILAASAARPRPNPLLNIVALGAGSYLAYRGATGYCPLKAALFQGRDKDDLLERGASYGRARLSARDHAIDG